MSARRPKAGPLTGWLPGSRVRTTKPIRAGSRPGEVLPVGTIATLDRVQRIQDGQEIWTMWVRSERALNVAGFTLWAGCHTQLEHDATSQAGSPGRPLEARQGRGTPGGPLAPPAAPCEAPRAPGEGAPTPRSQAPTNAPR